MSPLCCNLPWKCMLVKYKMKQKAVFSCHIDNLLEAKYTSQYPSCCNWYGSLCSSFDVWYFSCCSIMPIAPIIIGNIYTFTWFLVCAFSASSRYLSIFSLSFIATWWSWDVVTSTKYCFLATWLLWPVCWVWPLNQFAHPTAPWHCC